MTRAVVVGASIAGIVAARVLADAVDEVLVLERESLHGPVRAVPVPQAAHVHVLLRRGHRDLERLFPGFDAALGARGAPRVDWARNVTWVTSYGTGPRIRSHLRSRLASRPLIDEVLLDLLRRRPNVTVEGGREVVGLEGDAAAVTGVRVLTRGSDAPPETVGAWLVLDASGRSSRVPVFLADLGSPLPPETVVDASLRYATRVYRGPAGTTDGLGIVIHDRPPGTSRGGVALAMEGGRWLVTLGGAGEGDHPPLDEAGFSAFAASLLAPGVHDLMERAEPVSPIRGWARTANRWRHAEAVAGWPRGLAVVGDSLCALNPVYGQGMSVAAMEGPVLARWLRSAPTRRAKRGNEPPDTRAVLRALAGVARLPWQLAVAEDVRIPGVVGATEPALRVRASRWYLDAVLRAAPGDPATFRRLSDVTNLVRPPLALLDPAVVWRVVRSR